MLLKLASVRFVRFGENTTSRFAPNSLRNVIAVFAAATTSVCFAGSYVAPLNEIVITWQSRFASSFCSDATVKSYFFRIAGNCVIRIPRNPVSFITSRMSVKGTGGNEFQRLAPSAHFTFLLAGSREAERASVAPKSASAERRVSDNPVIDTDLTRFAQRLPLRARGAAAASPPGTESPASPAPDAPCAA